ncbi:hypothetical protein AB0O67_22190 [Streptomyces sp. NPDC086077]|uniref:hypothetical protein n=1 Tax=Streptomyces sp. NPDC086077 TaxID=3154862 RepID=UPI00342F9D33
MSGDKDRKQPNPHAAEHQEAAQQNGSLDAVMSMTKLVDLSPLGSVRGLHFGKSSFEGYDLNKMIDIVESANPELLDAAGEAIISARNAIDAAAEELTLNLGDVDWEGEARNAVHKWGNDLATTARELATYADVVGTQVFAASSGLASVRKSMPPRDTRTDPKTVDDIPEAKRVESNEAYTAAVQAEKHRQEAINQMYRLASFYTVSNGMMQQAEEPVFPKMPDVGVPTPAPLREDPGTPIAAQVGQGTLAAGGDPGTVRNVVDSEAGRPRAEGLPSSHDGAGNSIGPSARHVGTEIDSVGTLPPQDTMKPTPVTSPPTTGPNVTPVVAPPVAPPAASPLPRGPVGRTSNFGGGPTPRTLTPAPGRAVGGTPTGSPAGRTATGPMAPVGRAATPGQASGRATGGPVGRGITGGMPRLVGPAAGQAGGVPRGPVTGMGPMNPGRAATGRSGVGRGSDGVVGGRSVTGTTSGTSGSRVPPGTVIGGQSAAASRGTGERPGQRGVIGSRNPSPGAAEEPRRSVGSGNGVVGAPTERAREVRGRGPTQGSSSATRGPGGNERSGATRERRDVRRNGSSSAE